MRKAIPLFIALSLILFNRTKLLADEKEVILEIKKDPFEIEIEGKEKKKKQKEEKGSKKDEEKKLKRDKENLNLKLVGAAVSEDKKLILIELDGEKYILSEGDSVQNIKVKKISDGHIELLVGKDEFRLSF